MVVDAHRISDVISLIIHVIISRISISTSIHLHLLEMTLNLFLLNFSKHFELLHDFSSVGGDFMADRSVSFIVNIMLYLLI